MIEIVGVVNQHNHPPSAVRVELNKVRSNIRDHAETTRETPENIIANELATASATVAANLPRIETLKRAIRSQRSNDRPPTPVYRLFWPHD